MFSENWVIVKLINYYIVNYNLIFRFMLRDNDDVNPKG